MTAVRPIAVQPGTGRPGTGTPAVTGDRTPAPPARHPLSTRHDADGVDHERPPMRSPAPDRSRPRL
jgi:hypothetical protein